MIDKLLVSQLEYTSYSLQKNLEGITHEESLAQPHAGGNCINWVVGHIVHHRNIMHRHVRIEPAWANEKEQRYFRGSSPLTSATEAEDLPALLALYEASQSALTARLREMRSEDLMRVTDGKPLATILAGLVFHESYHVGQLGMIRRVIGRDAALT